MHVYNASNRNLYDKYFTQQYRYSKCYDKQCIQLKKTTSYFLQEKNRSKEGPQKLPFYVIPVYLGNLTES
jgi:hypothetical protein